MWEQFLILPGESQSLERRKSVTPRLYSARSVRAKGNVILSSAKMILPMTCGHVDVVCVCGLTYEGFFLLPTNYHVTLVCSIVHYHRDVIRGQ